MTLEEAIHQACSSVGITPPKERTPRRWLLADVVGKRSKGDGRVIMDDDRVSAFNWATGEKATVWLKEQPTPEDRRRFAQRRERDESRDRERAARAATIAGKIITTAQMDSHAYLRRKGFQNEKALVIGADAIREIGGDYLIPDSAKSAIVVPARIGHRPTSAQLIWEDGTKKFLAGGQMGGAWHRIATGTDTWLCEGYATALSLRMALKGLGRRDTVLVCFSAANIARVAGAVRGRCFIAADHDVPPSANPDQFGGLGAGEHYARQTGKPYTMPPSEKMDLNDLHVAEGIFAVQRLLLGLVREQSE